MIDCFQAGLEEGRQTLNLLANLQERLVQSEQGPVVLGTPTTSNTGRLTWLQYNTLIHHFMQPDLGIHFLPIIS